MMKTAVVGKATASLGKHLIAELWTDSSMLLNDENHVRKAMIAAANAADVTIIDMNVHKFSPHGLTGYILLSESHISIHTWPEYGYAAVDIFTCGGKPKNALEEFKKLLRANRMEVKSLDRGTI